MKKDTQNYLNIKEQTQDFKLHKLVSNEEVNNMKRLNYDDYYLEPKHFNRKIRELDELYRIRSVYRFEVHDETSILFASWSKTWGRLIKNLVEHRSDCVLLKIRY